MRNSGLRAISHTWNVKQTRYAVEHPWREAVILPISLLAGFIISWAIIGVRSWQAELTAALIGFVIVWCVRGRYNSGERGKERNLARLQNLEAPAV